MQPIEPLVLDAWRRLSGQILSNPDELRRRLARRRSALLTRPPRPWCLAIRASDTRLPKDDGGKMKDEVNAEPQFGNSASSALCPHPSALPSSSLHSAHTVTLTAPLVRELSRPVQLEPPGELWNHAAAKLGVGYCGLRHARATGALRTHYIRGLLGRRGKPIPTVYSPELLDPCAHSAFAAPDHLWTGHECVSARVPNDLVQTLTRVPVYRPTTHKHQYDEHAHPEAAEPPRPKPRPCLPPPGPDYVWYKWSKAGEYLGDDPQYWRKSPHDPGIPPSPHAGAERNRVAPDSPALTDPARREYALGRRGENPRAPRSSSSLRFLGWRWKCPKCNRLVNNIYRPAPPQPVIDLPKDEGERMKDEVNPQPELGTSSLSALPPSSFSLHPSALSVPPSSFSLHPSSFACARCHRIRNTSRIDRHYWNDLISHLSGGLLFGREVPQPQWLKDTALRKREYRPRVNRPAPRRQQVLELLLQGWPLTRIAAHLRIKYVTAYNKLRELYRQENVTDRRSLALKHGCLHPQPPHPRETARHRRERVIELLATGLSYKQIATEVSASYDVIIKDMERLRRQHGVNGRQQLIEKRSACSEQSRAA